MKLFKSKLAMILVVVLLVQCFASFAMVHASDTLHIDFIENTEPLGGNPGKGWVKYSSSAINNEKEIWPLISVGYMRYNWCDIEPEEGKFDWSIIDADIEYFASKGKRFAFGVMGLNGASTNVSETPEWVFEAGAEYYEDENSLGHAGGNYQNAKKRVPIWDDPIYLEKVENLVKAMAEKYDGDPRIEFIDYRSVGNYGEGHMGSMKTGGTIATAIEIPHMDIHKKYFKKTMIVNCLDSLGDAKESLSDAQEALDRGLALRYDGILTGIYSGNILKLAHGRQPTIFEFAGTYTEMLGKGTYSLDGQGRQWTTTGLSMIVNDAKPSYIPLGHWGSEADMMYEDNKEFVRQLTNKMGYHFVLNSVDIPSSAGVGQTFDMDMNWMNKGVAYLYKDCRLAIGLFDQDGNLIQKEWLTSINPRDWEPEIPVGFTQSVSFGNTQDGEYTVAVGLFLDEDETPDYRIGNYGINESGWYTLFGAKKTGNQFVFTPVSDILSVNKVVCDNPVIQKNGISYFPLRETFEKLGGTVVHKGGDSVDVMYDGCYIKFGNGTVFVGADQCETAEPYFIEKGTTYVSENVVRAIGLLDIEVTSTKVDIVSKKLSQNVNSTVTDALRDGSFESNGYTWSFDDSIYSFSTDTATDGTQSMKVSSMKAEKELYQTVELTSNDLYSFTFDILSDTDFSYFVMDAETEDVLVEEYISSTNGEWKTFQDKFDPWKSELFVDSVVKIGFKTVTNDEKTVYIDNVRIERLTPEETEENFAKNGDFERIRQDYTKTRNTGTTKYVKDNPQSGEYCLLFCNRGAWSSFASQTDLLGELGKFRLEFWARRAEGSEPTVLRVLANEPDYLTQYYINDYVVCFVLNTEWTKYEVDFEITEENAAEYNTRICFYTQDANVAGLTWPQPDVYIDNVRVVRVD